MYKKKKVNVSVFYMMYYRYLFVILRKKVSICHSVNNNSKARALVYYIYIFFGECISLLYEVYPKKNSLLYEVVSHI